MKRILILLAVTLSAINLFAQGKTVDKTLKLRDFNSINLSSMWNVELEYGSRQSVVLTYSEELEPYIVAKVKGKELELSYSMDDMPRKLRNEINRSGYNGGAGTYTLKATIVSSDLEAIDASGAVDVHCSGEFKADDFFLDLSGAANIKNLELSVTSLYMDVSGAGQLDIPSLNATECSMDLSGASSVYVEGDIDEAFMDASGASNVTISGNYTTFNIDASGACDIRISGKAGKLSVDASGACDIRARELYADDVFAGGSGASSITVQPVKEITIDISGATTLRYPKGVSTKIYSISRGCNIDTF